MLPFKLSFFSFKYCGRDNQQLHLDWLDRNSILGFPSYIKLSLPGAPSIILRVRSSNSLFIPVPSFAETLIHATLNSSAKS